MKRLVSILMIIAMLSGAFAALAEEVEILGEVVAESDDESEIPEVDADVPEEEAETPEETGRLSGLIIGVDAGHQGKADNSKELASPKGKEKKAKVASGTSGRSTGVPEYQTNLEISLKLRDALEAEGATVIMSRETNDISISNKERAELMNKSKCDMVLRIHCNGANKKSVSGTSLYIRNTCAFGKKEVPNPKELMAAEKEAADILIEAMCARTGAKNGGVFKRDTYTMNNWSTVPIILVECGYMTNYEEDENLNNPEYQDKLCAGMVDGLIEYFGR